MRNRLMEAFFVHATVSAAEPYGRFRYLRLHAPHLKDIAWTPGQQVRIDCGPAEARMPVLRTYSVWAHEDDWIDLYCLVHGDGPGSGWADRVRPGDQVLFTKPKGDFVVQPAAYHVFVGEETASAAFGPMIRALTAPVHAMVEADDEADRLPLTGDVRWVPADALLAAVTSWQLPDEPGMAYVAGEARTVQAVRNNLVRDRGWPRRNVRTKPFWTPGKRGME